VDIFELLKMMKWENFDRRYIIRGLIDGSLSSLGVVIGASGGDVSTIITAGIGGGIANGISNILGALTAERAMVESERSSQEKVLLIKTGHLKKTDSYREAVNKTTICGIGDGISTAFGSIIPVIPFFIFDKSTAIIIATLITLIILFLLGVFIGKISRDNIMISGLKMVIGGVVVAIICTIIENLL